LGLPIGQHISFKYVNDEGKDVIRSYTPVSCDEDLGFVDFVIKVYFKDVHPNFPLGGKMTQHLNGLKVGDVMLMKGPKGHLEYLAPGKLTIKRPKKVVHDYQKVRHIGMIAGGTGITPMMQVIRAVLRNPDDKTVMWLIFANQTEEDILLRKELEAIPSDRLKLWYSLDRPPEGGQSTWQYSAGFINTEMCRAHLPPVTVSDDASSAESLFLVCGPPPMLKYALEPAFKELGIPDHQWFAF
jgi:cytochrome-b5 reductase